MKTDASAARDAGEGGLPRTLYGSESFWAIVLVIVVGNFAGTLAAGDQLCKIPIQHILKETLHVQREDVARFFFLSGLFFYLKPLAGILTDAFPLFGTRRRWYLILSSIGAAIAWVVLAAVPKTYGTLLLGVIVIDLFVVMISTVVGAFLVELGQSRGEVAKLTAVRGIARSVLFTVQGPLSGLLAGTVLWAAGGVGSLISLSILPVAIFFVKERRNVQPNRMAVRNAGNQMATIARCWPFWMATIFCALYYFAPGLATMTYFRQNDVLHLSQQTIGLLGAVGNVAGIGAAGIYFAFSQRLALKTTLTVGIVASAISAFLYRWYNTPTLAFLIDFQNGFFGTYIQVAIMDLAARAAPVGCEGLAYSFIMSILNLSSQGSDWLGSHLADQYHLTWNTMVYVNAGTTLLSLVLVPFVPKVLLEGRDRERPEAAVQGS